MEKDLYKVEFIEGEPCCRFNGELSTEDWWFNKCGMDGEVEITETHILKGNKLYLKKGQSILTFLEAIGQRYQPMGKYDMPSNSGYGAVDYRAKLSILGDKGAIVIRDPDWLKDLQILPYSRFKSDYPKFNEREYKKLIESLDVYYAKT